MAKTWLSKDPDERDLRCYDWSDDLNEGETLDAASAITLIDAAGVEIDDAEVAPTTITVWLVGGTEGETATFLSRAVTSTGRIMEDTVLLPIASVLAPLPYAGGYVEPSAANLIFVFPEFATVPKERIDYYLERAARAVDTNWSEGDFGHARMLLAAHLMTMNGIGDTAEARSVASGAVQFKSIRSGSLSLDRGDTAATAGAFETTRYGREFKTLRRMNRGGPRFTGGISIGGGDGDHFGPWTQQ